VGAGPNKGKNFVVNGMRSYVVPSCMYCKIESLAMVKKTMGFGIKFLKHYNSNCPIGLTFEANKIFGNKTGYDRA
jgi:hypothetical protein